MVQKAPTRVLLADDHAAIREGLRRLLTRMPGIEVVGEAANGLQALQSVQELNPDVLLLDIEMPGLSGIDVARRLHEAKHAVKILIFSAYDDREYIRALYEMGVAGYLLKDNPLDEIVQAVCSVAASSQQHSVSSDPIEEIG